MYSAEQIQDARRRQIETVLGMAGRTFEGVERLIALNLRTARTAIDDASQASLAALNSRDIPTLVQVRIGSVQPAAEKASAYSRDLVDIVSSTGAELKRIAEAAASDARERLQQAIAAAKAQASAAPTVAASVVETSVEAGSEVADELAQTLQAAADEGGAAVEAAAVEAAAEPSIVVTTDAPPKPQSTPRARRSAT